MTITLRAFIFLLSTALMACSQHDDEQKMQITALNSLEKAPTWQQERLRLGAEQASRYLPDLQNKKVGLVLNQTSMIYHAEKDNKALSSPVHLVDFLLSHNINVTVLFAPEHGVRGNKGAGEYIESGKDTETQLPIASIYGPNKTPDADIMQSLDVIVFDIQDVGTRFYTYISSMHYMMEAAATHGVEFIVLDRPNPNGDFIDGPVLDMQFQSFVGMHPIPVLHGLTVGELAKVIVGENWIENADKLSLKVVTMQNYHKQLAYELPVAPSPNLPNHQAVRLYPSLCFFEPTEVSIGRGTDFPFQVTGHNQIKLGEFAFTPVSKPYAAPKPKLMDVEVFGKDLRASEDIRGLNLSLFITYRSEFKTQEHEFYTSTTFFDKLAGTDRLRLAIDRGDSVEQIRKSWEPSLQQYKSMINQYLQYPMTSEQPKT